MNSEQLFTDYSRLDDNQKQQIANLWNLTDQLFNQLKLIPDCRRKSIAITHVETALMFASAAIGYNE